MLSTIGCKTRETMCKILDSSSRNSHQSQKICRLHNLPPPPESMLITPSGTIVISYCGQHCAGERQGIFEISPKKRSSVSSVL